MKIITAKTGESILVDDEDFEALSKYKWRINDGYACRTTTVNHKTVTYRMHRLIMGLGRGTEDSRIVDHINKNRLDNQKGNLRIADRLLNSQNSSIRHTNKSGYKGVRKHSRKHRNKLWSSEIRHLGKQICIGYYETAEDAYSAYCQKAIELRGFV